MNLMNAIERRISCRAYADSPLTGAEFDQIRAMVEEVNAASGLNILLRGPRGEGETAIDMAGAMFSGPVYAYLALAAPDDPLSGERLGYWGELLVLRLTDMGLGTCWVASTYDAKTLRAEIPEGERLWDVIPIGRPAEKQPLKQRTVRASLRARSKKAEQLVESDVPYAQLPEWFRAGVEAAGKGPSAVNRQPVVFGWHAGRVTAALTTDKYGIEYNDLGIAKRHFEVAANAHGVDGKWAFGNGAAFEYAPND